MRLQIGKVVYGGFGLARIPAGQSISAKTLFVPFTLPGELVEAELSTDSSPEEARLVQILQPAAARVDPSCIHFGSCGGCQYQHASYSAQIEIKTDNLRETLEHAGVAPPHVQEHVAEPWAYRNKIRLRVAVHGGSLRVGYTQRGSGAFLPIRECPIAAPLLWRAAQNLCEAGATDAIGRALLEQAAEIEFFCDSTEGRVQMVLFLRSQRTHKLHNEQFQALCERIKQRLPQLVGAGLVRFLPEAGRPGRRSQRTEKLMDWGAEGLSYTAGGRDYWVARGGFFQVNRFLLEDLLGTVATGRSGSIAWDLYAGVGLFSRALEQNFGQVVAVEAADTAAAELLRLAKRTSLRAVHSSTQNFLAAAVLQRERPDLIVVDPPRAGLGAEVCNLLARITAPELVYVSCDPVTLARDLKLLIESGYRLVELHLFDLFPQTFHLETIAVLRR